MARKIKSDPGAMDPDPPKPQPEPMWDDNPPTGSAETAAGSPEPDHPFDPNPPTGSGEPDHPPQGGDDADPDGSDAGADAGSEENEADPDGTEEIEAIAAADDDAGSDEDPDADEPTVTVLPSPANMSKADLIRYYVERVETADDRIKKAQKERRRILNDAHDQGLDKGTLSDMIKLRKKSSFDRQEADSLQQVYRAALGILDGTPLGATAIKRLEKPERLTPPANDQQVPEAPDATADVADQADAPADNPLIKMLAPSQVSEADIDTARHEGREAASKGEQVWMNPYFSADPRRAAWDEGWCQAAGSDGMEIPDAWRRRKDEPKATAKPDVPPEPAPADAPAADPQPEAEPAPEADAAQTDADAEDQAAE